MSKLRRFLLYFAQENVDFRYPEIKSLIKFFNLDIKLPQVGDRPYWILENVVESDLKKIASRSMSLRYIVEIFSTGNSYTSFHDNLRKYCSTELDSDLLSPSFRVTVETYNKHFGHTEKIGKIESMIYLPFTGKIELKTPDNNYIYFEYWGIDPTNVPPEPEEIIFGRWIADGQRDMVKTIALRHRKFIGNTSMNPLLSLLMANQALCDKNQIMFDPFAGTGSILVSAAKFGSYVIGSDIDYQMLHAKTKPSRVRQKVREDDESIKANLLQYNLQHLYLDVFVGDFANCPLIDSIQFDSIITDPPYGIRERMEQIVPKEPRKLTVMTEDAVHYPSTSKYTMKRMYDDLMTFSAKHLKMGGRLVFWFPVNKDDYSENLLPQHSALQIIANSEQKLTADAVRRLLTYEKIRESGELTNVVELEEVSFRKKYLFTTDEQKEERRIATEKRHQHNVSEAQKRGVTLQTRAGRKQATNKKMMMDREAVRE